MVWGGGGLMLWLLSGPPDFFCSGIQFYCGRPWPAAYINFIQNTHQIQDLPNLYAVLKLLVREPAILLIKWLRPKSSRVWSYVVKYAEFKIQTLKKIGWYTKILCAAEYPGGRQFLKLAQKWGTLYHRI